MSNKTTLEERKAYRLVCLQKARDMSISKEMIDFGVHLHDSLGSATAALRAHSMSHEEWSEFVRLLQAQWKMYEEATGGFSIGDAVNASISLLLDGEPLHERAADITEQSRED